MKQDNKQSWASVIIVLISIALFSASLTQPAFTTQKPDDPIYSGLFVFALGWAGFLAGNMLAVIIWLANPLYLLAITFILKNKIPLATSLAALVLAVIFPFIDGIASSESGGGPFYPIAKLNAGYWLWLSAIGTITLSCIYHTLIKYKK